MIYVSIFRQSFRLHLMMDLWQDLNVLSGQRIPPPLDCYQETPIGLKWSSACSKNCRTEDSSWLDCQAFYPICYLLPSTDPNSNRSVLGATWSSLIFLDKRPNHWIRMPFKTCRPIVSSAGVKSQVSAHARMTPELISVFLCAFLPCIRIHACQPKSSFL